MVKGKATARVENWRVVGYKERRVLMGNVYDHPMFKDGTPISTSKITSINETEKKAETAHTIYTLGKKMAC